MLRFALAAIRFYQRCISPYKGFRCAHAVHGGGASCSTVGYRLLRRHGVFRGLRALRQRLRNCGEIHRLHHPPRPLASAQGGFCDVGCDLPCDLPGCEVPGCDMPSFGNAPRARDYLGCCDCGGCNGRNRTTTMRKQQRGQKGRAMTKYPDRS